MPFYDLVCANGHQRLDALLKIGERPACTECGEPTETLWLPQSSPAVVGDDIPGGVWIAHGICNNDGTPKKYYTKSSMAQAAKEKGLVNYVRHVGDKGSDKNKYTSRWT